MRTIVLAAAALLAAACISLNPYDHELRVPAGPQPNDALVEAFIKDYLPRSLKDPDSIKQYRYLGQVQTRWMRGAINGGGSEEGWLACFEYNAKNSYGGYTGVKTDGLVFRDVDGRPRFIMNQHGAIMARGC